MIPLFVRQRFLLSLTLLAFSVSHFPLPLFADVTQTNNMANPFAFLPEAKVPTLESAVAPTQTTPAQPPAQEQSDRKAGAGSAEKMAAIGAAIAAASCAMMMAQAAAMPPGPEKMQMMQQAMQQCAQAAANQKNAGENEKAKNAVANNNTPTGQQQTAKNSGNAKNLMPPAASSSSEEPEFPETSFDMPEPSLSDPSGIPEPGDIGNSYDFGTGGAVAGVSTPNSIESSEVGFNENNKGDEQRINPPGTGNFAGVGASGTLPTPGAKGEEEGGEGKGRRAGKGEESSDDFSTMDGQSGGGGSGSNGVAFDKMLSDIMGGKQEPIPVLGDSSGIVVLRNVGPRKMTIFELANTRYRRAGYNEGLVDVRKPGRYREPASIP